MKQGINKPCFPLQLVDKETVENVLRLWQQKGFGVFLHFSRKAFQLLLFQFSKKPDLLVKAGFILRAWFSLCVHLYTPPNGIELLSKDYILPISEGKDRITFYLGFVSVSPETASLIYSMVYPRTPNVFCSLSFCILVWVRICTSPLLQRPQVVMCALLAGV